MVLSAGRPQKGRTMDEHWSANARDGDRRHIGECDDGSWWLPSRRDPDVWDRRFSPWRPTHWPAWWRSRRDRQMTWLERA